MIKSINKFDAVGIISSKLCLIHCVATPFLFAAQTHIVSHASTTPFWWKTLDFFFLFLSALAVYQTTSNTSKKWVKHLMWLNWVFLLFLIGNEKISWLEIPEIFIYIPTLSLIVLHFYNAKYCQCKENCCDNNIGNE